METQLLSGVRLKSTECCLCFISCLLPSDLPSNSAQKYSGQVSAMPQGDLRDADRLTRIETGSEAVMKPGHRIAGLALKKPKAFQAVVVGSSGGNVVHVKLEVMGALGLFPTVGKCPRPNAPRTVDGQTALALSLQWSTPIGKSWVAMGFQPSSGDANIMNGSTRTHH